MPLKFTTIPIGNVSHEEWLKLRKKGIGGSDAGAICCLNPYASPLSVYMDKTGAVEEKTDNEAMRLGRDLENYVAKRFCEETGLKVRKSNMMYISQENPFMLADVDRLVVGEDAGLECKTTSAYNADKWKEDDIPPYYVIQCYHYMAVTGKKNWYLAVLILGVGFKYVKLSWDDDIIRSLIQIEKEFWNNHVLVKVMPDPDGSSVCDKLIEQYFHSAKKDSEIPLIGFDEKLKRRTELQKLMVKLQTEQDQIDQELKLYMRDNEAASNEHYRVLWSNVETVRLDSKRLKKERPEIYKDFSYCSSSRRFTVKAVNAA